MYTVRVNTISQMNITVCTWNEFNSSEFVVQLLRDVRVLDIHIQSHTFMSVVKRNMHFILYKVVTLIYIEGYCHCIQKSKNYYVLIGKNWIRKKVIRCRYFDRYLVTTLIVPVMWISNWRRKRWVLYYVVHWCFFIYFQVLFSSRAVFDKLKTYVYCWLVQIYMWFSILRPFCSFFLCGDALKAV